MADEKETTPALLVRRISDGAEFGVTQRRYEELVDSNEYEDNGSTDLSVDAVPLHDELPLPKVETLKEAGFRTLGAVREAGMEGLQEVDGIGESSAEKIMAILSSA